MTKPTTPDDSTLDLVRALNGSAVPDMLAQRQSSVNDAWEESGFTDLPSFERAFKKWVGCSPLAYRKQVLDI